MCLGMLEIRNKKRRRKKKRKNKKNETETCRSDTTTATASEAECGEIHVRRKNGISETKTGHSARVYCSRLFSPPFHISYPTSSSCFIVGRCRVASNETTQDSWVKAEPRTTAREISECINIEQFFRFRKKPLKPKRTTTTAKWNEGSFLLLIAFSFSLAFFLLSIFIHFSPRLLSLLFYISQAHTTCSSIPFHLRSVVSYSLIFCRESAKLCWRRCLETRETLTHCDLMILVIRSSEFWTCSHFLFKKSNRYVECC